MPAVIISVSKLQNLFQEGDGTTIATPLGNTLLEIQGDLQFPSEPPSNDEDERFSEYEEENVVRFGVLSFDSEYKKATLYVGEKQRLLGSVVKLETPLGLLKFDHETNRVELEDVINYKVIFKERPLPIM